MKYYMQNLIYLGLALSLFATGPGYASEGSPALKEATAILKSNQEDAVEALVRVGSKSASSAAVVIVEVLKQSPRLLNEVIEGLALMLTSEQLQKAIDLAAFSIKDNKVLLDLLHNVIATFGCTSIERCADRINEVPGNIEDGSGDPIVPPPPPPSSPA